MTNDEILAVLENARMDLERAFAAIDQLPVAYSLGLHNVRIFCKRVQRNIDLLKGETNERG
jgi:hypothetical protein